MTDFLGKVVQDQDVIKSILAKLPGFKGYIERQNRRDADKLLRDKIAREYESLWQRISSLQKEMLNQGGLAYVDDMESAAVKLRAFIDRVRTATYGHSSLFNAVKINEAELARLYEFDLSLLNMVDAMSSALDNIEAAIGTDGLAVTIRQLVTLSTQCIETFNQRVDVITTQTAAGSTAITEVQSSQ